MPFRDLCHQPNESLVDSVLFDKAQAPLAERGERRGRRIAQAHPSQMLSGLVVCGHCHHNYVGVAAAGKGHRYRCYMCFSRRRYGKAACVGERLRADVLEDTVFGVLLNVCKDPERIERAVAAKTQERATSVRSQRDEILATETELKKTEAAIERYMMAFEAGSITDDLFGPWVRDLSDNARARRARHEKVIQIEGIAAMDPPTKAASTRSEPTSKTSCCTGPTRGARPSPKPSSTDSSSTDATPSTPPSS